MSESSTAAAGPAGAVFISYASQDASAARRISDALSASGIEVWFDRSELRGGDAWDQMIRRQIRECTLFLPIVSASTQARVEGYFRREWKLAVERTHDMADGVPFLVPVVIDGTHDSEATVPEPFRVVQWTHLPGGETPTSFIGRVAALLTTSSLRYGTPPVPPAVRPPAVSLQAVAAASAPAKSRSPALLVTAIVMAGVVGIVAFGILRKPSHVSATRPAAEEGSVPSAASTAPTAAAIPEKSIAVLPFVNMSADKEQEYFSDGLSEELIDMLARNPELHVPARTSSFFFKGKTQDIAEIAAKLKVANVLEGSVRRAGNRLRVTAQLIRADNGYHLWSETYDRDAKDVFKVQDEISAAVVTALKVHLLSTTEAAGQRTNNADAYSHYLIGRALLARGDWRLAPEASQSLRLAIKLDPAYAPAWAMLASALDDEGELAGPSEQERLRHEALAAANKAIALGPEIPDGYATRGTLRAYNEQDFRGADADYRRALSLAPTDTRVLRGYATQVLGPTGRAAEAEATMRRVLAADPLSSLAWRSLALELEAQGKDAESIPALERSLEISPEQSNTASILANALVREGHPERALEWAKQSTTEAFRDQSTAIALRALGRTAEADRQLAAMIEHGADTAAFQIAEVYAWWDDKDQAFKWLERAHAQHDAGLIAIKINPNLRKLRSDPRYLALLRRLNVDP